MTHIHHSHRKTGWHCYMREMRLVWKKKRDDGGGAVSIAGENEGKNREYQKTWQDVLGEISGATKDKLIAAVPEKLLHDLERHSKTRDALGAYLEENKERIAATVFEHGGYALRDAESILMDIAQGKPPEQIRLKIEDIVAPKKKPEKDDALASALQEHRPEKNETPEKKLSRWQKLLARAATLANPLYRRIASFLRNPAVADLGLSPDAIFEDLRDGVKRLPLLKKLADARFDLVHEDSATILDRKAALGDLQAIITHSLFLLSPDQRGEFYEIFARVGAAMALVEEEEGLIEGRKTAPEKSAEANAIEESEDVVIFLKNERGKERKITGENGLRMRLETKGANSIIQPNVYGILAEGLKDGNWLDAMHESQSLKYSCALIALEECAILKRMIGYGKTATPADLAWYVKNAVLNAFRRQTGGLREERASLIVRNETTEQARADFESLQMKVKLQERPSRADADELLLLYAWLHANDPSFDRQEDVKREIAALGKNAEMTSAELKTESKRARESLQDAMMDASPLRAKMLRNADLLVLENALVDISEERILFERRERIRLKKDAASQKDLWKLNREPSLLHEKSDEEYMEKRRQIIRKLSEQEVSLAALTENEEIRALNAEYDKERELRGEMQDALITECDEKLRTTITAEIRAQSADLLEEYSATLFDKMKAKLKAQGHKEQITLERLAEIIETMNWGDLPAVLSTAEMSTVRSLQLLKCCDLNTASFEDVTTFIGDLHAIEQSVHENDNEEKEWPQTMENVLRHPRLQESLNKALNREDEKTSRTEKSNVEELETKLHLVSNRIAKTFPEFADTGNALAVKMLEKIEEEKQAILAHTKNARLRAPHGAEMLADAKQRLRTLEKFISYLEEVTTEELRSEAFAAYIQKEPSLREKEPSYVWGVFDRENKKIVLNKTAIAHDKKNQDMRRSLTLFHEKQHALHEAFSILCPAFLTDAYDAFSGRVTGFKERCEHYEQKGNLADAAVQHDATDEFLARYAVYKRAKSIFGGTIDPDHLPPGLGISRNDIEVFERLEGSEIPISFQDAKNRLRQRKLMAFDDDFDDYATGAATATMPAGATQAKGVESSRNAQTILDIEGKLILIRKFFESYEEQATPENVGMIDEIEKNFNDAHKKYQDDSEAEKNEEITNEFSQIKTTLGKIEDMIAVFDTERREDVMKAPQERKFLSALWNSIEIMSVNDFIAIYKAIAEDVKRQNNRRQQGRIGRVGRSLLGWLDKTPILKDLPYFGTVSSEFYRRDKHAEQEEVENWKKTLDELDAFELQEMLFHPANKDQMKAILFLLADRGRVPWGDKHFWYALNGLSKFKMPIDPCERNETLMEDWLRKMISDLWDDKDLFRKLRTTHSSGIKDGKAKFEPESDRLSNLKGGLNGELEKQLRIFSEVKRRQKKRENISMPDDIQPHLYEEIIHYSIVNGKMSMEEKFYYLVQGQACGLLASDRIRSLAGKGGGLLNIFPFIDYFYGKNNSKAEIESLAARLRETNDPASPDFYKPGIRTTLWLELEMVREPKVQERLRKGVDKQSGEMDHDDMHFFIPRMNAETINSMAMPQGGGRQKMSTDGWLNGYIGFNQFFKSLGTLAQLEKDRQENAKFTEEDVTQALQAIAGYIQMDGILTSRSNYRYTGARPGATYSTMKNFYSVCGDKQSSVYTERQKMKAFIKDVMEAYQDENSGELTKENIDLILYDTETQPMPDQEKQTKIYVQNNHLPRYLENAVKRNAEPLKEILKKHLTELFTSSKLDYQKAKEVWTDFRTKQHTYEL